MFVFRSRAAKAIKLLVYNGQGFWLAQKTDCPRAVFAIGRAPPMWQAGHCWRTSLPP
jgi:hypothetical protein